MEQNRKVAYALNDAYKPRFFRIHPRELWYSTILNIGMESGLLSDGRIKPGGHELIAALSDGTDLYISAENDVLFFSADDCRLAEVRELLKQAEKTANATFLNDHVPPEEHNLGNPMTIDWENETEDAE